MPYRYETHCHSAEGSKCSKIPIVELVGFYHRMGYSGVCLTDHFTGNSPLIPDKMPWNERVEFYYDIYLKGCEIAGKYGIAVFFGLEYSIAPDIDFPSTRIGNDFVFLNLSKEWYLENKSVFRCKPREMLATIRKAGGFIIQAHPFGEFLAHHWYDGIRLYPRDVDATEIKGNGAVLNLNKVYAQTYNLFDVTGTDTHSDDVKIMFGMETDEPCLTPAEFVEAIKSGRARPFQFDRTDLVDAKFPMK